MRAVSLTSDPRCRGILGVWKGVEGGCQGVLDNFMAAEAVSRYIHAAVGVVKGRIGERAVEVTVEVRIEKEAVLEGGCDAGVGEAEGMGVWDGRQPLSPDLGGALQDGHALVDGQGCE